LHAPHARATGLVANQDPHRAGAPLRGSVGRFKWAYNGRHGARTVALDETSATTITSEPVGPPRGGRVSPPRTRKREICVPEDFMATPRPTE